MWVTCGRKVLTFDAIHQQYQVSLLYVHQVDTEIFAEQTLQASSKLPLLPVNTYVYDVIIQIYTVYVDHNLTCLK